MTELINVDRFGFTEKDIKIMVEYLAIDGHLNKGLIYKLLKFGTYIKKINNN